MIPYKADNPRVTTPFVTWLLIAANVIVFIIELNASKGIQWIANNYGAIPYNLVTLSSAQPVGPITSIFTSMFIHGGFLHIAGNMLYLWIFGTNIEDRMGHLRFLVFYLIAGVIAAYANAIAVPDSGLPMVGASGAISGVLGAYLLLFPRAQVYTILFLGFFVQVIRLPALIVIGFWAIIQFASGIFSRLGPGGGIAYFAHIGGFLFGLFTVKLWIPAGRRRSW
ncbi:MAG: rhomboid family intramembrane serine protease [Actinomycetota bacterium]|nr:rhomboid family intramembrane serine protease [Actinomycetota bacterium]MDA8173404.1 rhomboid family intramembrane serine protease [Nitrospiraceae bacterium]